MATRPDPQGGYWTRKITNNAAAALLVYAALQIVATGAIETNGGGALASILGIVILVGLVIPAVRWLERDWRDRETIASSGADMKTRFRRDRRALWICAVILPFAWTGLFVLSRGLIFLFTS